MILDLIQICSIVSSARFALKNGEEIAFVPLGLERSITFSFLKRKNSPKKLCHKSEDGFYRFKHNASIAVMNTAMSVWEWFEYCTELGLINIQADYPEDLLRVQPYSLISQQPSIVCFFEDGSASRFIPDWRYLRRNDLFDIRYKEFSAPIAELEFKRYSDNTEQLKIVLQRVEHLSHKIGADAYAEKFRQCLVVLEGGSVKGQLSRSVPSLSIPRHRQQLFDAAVLACSFDLMRYFSEIKSEEVQQEAADIILQELWELIEELQKQIRLAMLYAVNES